jgi:hypothetical protein
MFDMTANLAAAVRHSPMGTRGWPVLASLSAKWAAPRSHCHTGAASGRGVCKPKGLRAGMCGRLAGMCATRADVRKLISLAPRSTAAAATGHCSSGDITGKEAWK